MFRSQWLLQASQLLLEDGIQIVAPQILRNEFLNAALRLEQRGALSPPEVDVAIGRFQRLGVAFLDSEVWVRSAFALARRYHQRNIFDAMYLACAEELDLIFWTADRRFVASFGADRPARLRLCPDDM